MLIISSGMQKSGSAYFYNVINEILAASDNGVDARKIKNNSSLDDLMKWHNNNIGALTLTKLLKLWKVSVREGTFVVKTHAGPNLSVKALNKLGMIRIVYCYRDPRDVLLSAIDHGKKILDNGENHTFANMVEFDKALKNVKSWLCIWKSYAELPGVLTVKYEEMMQDPGAVTKKIEDYLEVSVNPEKRQEILWKFSKENSEGDRRGMHFNKAQTYRYKTEMTEEQKAKCKEKFNDLLLAMGYESE
jgi:hypothetical protein